MPATRKRRRIEFAPALLIGAFVLLTAIACSSATRATPGPAPLSADLEVRWAPIPVPADGRWHLVYELHVRNLSEPGLALQSAEVIADVGTSPPAYYWRSDISTDATRRVEVLPGGASETLVLYVWLTLDRDEIPQALRHRVTLISADGRTAAVEGAVTPVATTPLLVIDPPLRGRNWIATNGPSNDSGHRRAIHDSGGTGLVPQRFATDWVRAHPERSVVDGSETYEGDRLVNANHFAYREDVLAVADGVVTTIIDGVPDNTPDTIPERLFGDALAGNYVIIRIAGGFAVYAHLSPNTIRVQEGDVVYKGQRIARVGNSGASSKPHLHFHIGDADAVLQAEGLPYVIEHFERLGRLSEDGSTVEQSSFDVRTLELPLSGTIVNFD